MKSILLSALVLGATFDAHARERGTPGVHFRPQSAGDTQAEKAARKSDERDSPGQSQVPDDALAAAESQPTQSSDELPPEQQSDSPTGLHSSPIPQSPEEPQASSESPATGDLKLSAESQQVGEAPSSGAPLLSAENDSSKGSEASGDPQPDSELQVTGDLQLSEELQQSGDPQFSDATADVPTTEEENGRFADWRKSFRVTLNHEISDKFQAPKRIVNNRSSGRLEFSRVFAEKYFVRLDTKLNLFWDADHRAKAEDKTLAHELVTREAYVQASFGDTSFRLGSQILPWGISEAGAITDEISPRNLSEFFFISLEESRIGQPMLAVDRFSGVGEWQFFFVPRPAYNKYPPPRTEYDIPGAFDVQKPDRNWTDRDDFEYGLRWKRTFGKSDISLMAASLIDNDDLIRKQRFTMFGLTANLALGNFLYRSEIAVKQPKVFLSQPVVGGPTSVFESDQLDSSLGFDYSPGGRVLTYSAEIVRSHLFTWDQSVLGRQRDDYALVTSVTNKFMNDDLSFTWLMIYGKPYTSFEHKFLTSYRLSDNDSLYFDVFYPDERDRRSGNWPYRHEKQFVIRYQYQF